MSTLKRAPTKLCNSLDAEKCIAGLGEVDDIASNWNRFAQLVRRVSAPHNRAETVGLFV